MASAPPAGTTGLTYADLLTYPLPSEAGGTRYELLDGELLVTPTPVPRHQLAVARITSALLAHVDEHGGVALPAPLDVRFSDDTVFEPDVVVLAADHVDRLDDRGVDGSPDLVVEVSSPSTRRTDLVRKRRVYEREGVGEFWFVDLEADQVQCYRLAPDGTYGPPTVVLADGRVASTVLPEFTLPATTALAIEDS